MTHSPWWSWCMNGQVAKKNMGKWGICDLQKPAKWEQQSWTSTLQKDTNWILVDKKWILVNNNATCAASVHPCVSLLEIYLFNVAFTRFTGDCWTDRKPSSWLSEDSASPIPILPKYVVLCGSMTFYDHVLVSLNALVADLTLYLYYWGASKSPIDDPSWWGHKPFERDHALLAHRVNILAGGKDNPGRQQKSEDIWDTAWRCIKNTIKMQLFMKKYAG